jgi:hypothetical protein
VHGHFSRDFVKDRFYLTELRLLFAEVLGQSG